MSLYARFAELPLTVERCRLERRTCVVATSAFRRSTTMVHLEGLGFEGTGEDVSYDAADHDAPVPPTVLEALRADDTLASFSGRLASARLWPRAPRVPIVRAYRRWAFESAALDLALRQSRLTLADALGRRPAPVSFVCSFRLGDPARFDPVVERLARYPSMRLKLDPTATWDEQLIAAIASTQAVDVVDLKGIARGTPVDQAPDPALYARVASGFPHALIEDPAVTPETLPVLAGHWERITWDAPVCAPEDVDRLPRRPRMINVKPSRFGTLERLLATYERCEAEGIGMYGGGQFELGPGRGQIQRLAALFHPTAPNDVAPSSYNDPHPPSGLPPSPLPALDGPPGF